jgi:hypothetical protein
MRHTKNATARIEELRATLAAYRHLTVEEAERGNWGDMQVELEAELWRLEQESLPQETRRRFAA